jgi:uncharacterized membrane protein
MHREQGKKTVLMVIAIAFLMLFPFVALPAGLYFIYQGGFSFLSILLTSLAFITVCIIIAVTTLILSQSLKNRKQLALGSPIGATVITLSFVISLLKVHKPQSFTWKGRTYM